mmetsp:Transcript_20303/g.81865  ORF Transcript_20303/g.81865 Transcript_20303/m.81865 type:complete len:117 (+) Transcript_20303:2577-2927(+)
MAVTHAIWNLILSDAGRREVFVQDPSSPLLSVSGLLDVEGLPRFPNYGYRTARYPDGSFVGERVRGAEWVQTCIRSLENSQESTKPAKSGLFELQDVLVSSVWVDGQEVRMEGLGR